MAHIDTHDTPRLVYALLAGLIATSGASAQARPARSSPSDLRDAFAPGFILQDRNRDDLVDFVHAQIVLPSRPSTAAIATAANLAARLGYETTAIDPGLVESRPVARVADRPVVLISHEQLDRARGLSPGQGALSVIAPESAYPLGGLALDGDDASGLLAIGAYVAGRYPSIWGLKGASHADVVQRISRFFEQDSVPADVRLVRIVVEQQRPGVSRVELQADIADSGSYARAVQLLVRADSALRDSAYARALGAPARDSTSAPPRVRPLELQFTDLHRIDIRLSIANGRSGRVFTLLPARPWGTRLGAEFSFRDAPDFTLSDLYTIRGLYRDTNQDLVPDRADAVLSLGDGLAASGIVDLAARIGLETAGMRLPLADVDRQRDDVQDAGFPIVAGLSHYHIDRLRREGRLHSARGDSAPGVGFLEFVRGGFGRHNGLVLTAVDTAGLRAVADYAANRMPYLWDFGKGKTELASIEHDVRRFVQARSPSGQTALALQKTRAWLDRLRGKDIDSIGLEVVTVERPAGLDAFLARELRSRLPGAKASVKTFQSGFGVGKEIFREEVELPWEVDEFRRVFRAALPRLTVQSRGRVEVRVSESPDVRARLAAEIRDALRGRGVPADAFEVVVLSAYKQGYSWLNDRVLPALSGKGAARIEIAYHHLKDSKEVRWQEIESDTRWLQELYPIDAVLAKALAIPDSAVVFRPTQQATPVYTVRAFDSAGRVLLEQSFDPKYVVRPFFDLFPEYESVRVTTGWVTIVANGEVVLDQRIRTDPEAFWDHFQQRTYRRLIEYTMDVQDGRPSPANAPYFDELRVDLALSEPNYRIGIDEEVISSLEALHEDIYFETLTLFTLLGNRFGVGDLAFLGRVLPYVQPSADGKPGRARIALTGKERGVPELVFTYRERGREPVRERYALSPLPLDPPKLRGIAVQAGRQEVRRLLFEVAALDSADRYEEYKARSSESAIDRTFAPTTLIDGMLGALNDLHAAGVLTNELSYDRVGEIAFRLVLRDTLSRHQRFASLARSRAPASTQLPTLRDRAFAYRGQPMVQWRTPIPPAESDSVLARLATFPTVNVYHAGTSFLGQPIFAADFMPPHEARFVSQAKRNALRPTLVISGRQHANEVSSTSHILALGERLATDTAYTTLLNKVNVVLHPITNPDGARLAYEMQLVNPDFMLHAGYLGALGVDPTAGAATPDGLYPEARVRPKLMDTWLPDIFVNMHGYPTHEWVQYFAGYSAWVRSRQGAQRSWWAPRGWFIPGYSWVDDPRYPEIKQAQFAVLDSIASSIIRLPNVEAMNRRLYARYQKYGKQDVDNFREYFHNGVLVSLALRGTREATGQGVNNPRVNYINITTEAPDETARGEWLELVASAGLAHSTALLRYLAGGTNDVRRESAEYDGFVNRSVSRKKPVLPTVSPQSR
jgi:hypothetical protein